LYCTPNIIKEIKRIRMRRERDEHFCRNLKRIGLMGCVDGDIKFIKQSYSNRMRVCTRSVRGHGLVLGF
jgi:hypothetical protein